MAFGTLNKDMQLTAAEFAKRLPRALDGFVWDQTPDGFRAQREAQTIEIQVMPQDPRRIGAIALPRCLVAFRFSGFSDQQQQAFIERFDRLYQKGGG